MHYKAAGYRFEPSTRETIVPLEICTPEIEGISLAITNIDSDRLWSIKITDTCFAKNLVYGYRIGRTRTRLIFEKMLERRGNKAKVGASIKKCNPGQT